MAVVGSSHILFLKDNALIFVKGKREHVLCDAIHPLLQRNSRKVADGSTTDPSLRKYKGTQCTSSQNGRSCLVIKASLNSERHLESLENYLGKLHDDAKLSYAKTSNWRNKFIDRSDQLKAENSLRSVEKYLVKIKDGELKHYMDENMEVIDTTIIDTSIKKNQGSGSLRSLNNYKDLKTEDAEAYLSADNITDFNIIALLASMNIAVFLFEIATPVKNSNFELFSLPLVYGAKINNLILTGEWWRLVTPMFLHSGIFHIALGSWILFTFGLDVSRKYGAFTFLLIYILGGISGNLVSYLHTPEPTVGGTGPVFAVIGAWLIYQLQNKDVLVREDSDRKFQRAVIVTALSCLLTNFGPIDDWTHFTAAVTGIAYGYVTCPSLQMKDASSSEGGRQERITLVRQYADPCKSLLYFSIFLLLLGSLLFVIEPPLDLIK